MNTYPSMTDLQARLLELGESPKDKGRVEMIVCRPDMGERRILERAELDLVSGLIGDNWRVRGSKHTEDGTAHPELQIAIMNSRVIQAIAQDQAQWALAGDQLFVDYDLSADNLLPGHRIAIGTVILEVTPFPHNGCKKFTERFGSDATRWINSEEGRHLRRRGINTRIIQPGTICVGDVVFKVNTEAG